MSIRYTAIGDEEIVKGRTIAICIGVSLQFTAFALMRAHVHNTQCDSVSLLWGELVKFCVSLALVPSCVDLLHDVKTAVVPTLCFCIMNILSFWALHRVSASTFVVILQLKLVWTSLFSCLMLGRRLSIAQMLTMVGISAGVVSISSPNAESTVTNNEIWPVGALVLETVLSGFSATWTQMSFASSANTMWVRNAQFALMSIVLYSGASLYNECALYPTRTGLLFGGTSALGGVLVALTLLYVGAIEKTVTTNFSTVFTFLVEGVVFGVHMERYKVLAAVCVFTNCWTFALLPRPDDRPCFRVF